MPERRAGAATCARILNAARDWVTAPELAAAAHISAGCARCWAREFVEQGIFEQREGERTAPRGKSPLQWRLARPEIAALREALAIARSWALFDVQTMDRKPASTALRLRAIQETLDKCTNP